MEKRSTLKEISKQTDVPVSTVAAVLREDPGCFAGQKLRQKILTAARQLHYRPNLIARILKTKKSNTLGLIVPNMQTSVTLSNMELIENLAWQRNYHLFIGYSQNDSIKEEALLADFVDRYVDGIILIVGLSSQKRPYLKHMISDGFPLVTINCLEKFNIPSISTDFHQGGMMAARHLLELGHRKIHIISVDFMHSTTLRQRIAGFQQALQEEGLKPEVALFLKKTKDVVPLEKIMMESYQSAKKVLSRKERPTAVFAGNDEIGLGVIKAALTLGIKVPEELSVVGFDDSPAAIFAPVPLTTIHQCKDRISRKAVEIILALVEQKEKKKKKAKAVSSILLKPELVIRSSTGPVPTA